MSSQQQKQAENGNSSGREAGGAMIDGLEAAAATAAGGSNKRRKTSSTPEAADTPPFLPEPQPIETLVEAVCDPESLSVALAPLLRFWPGSFEAEADRSPRPQWPEPGWVFQWCLEDDGWIFQWESEGLVIVRGKLNHGYAMVVLPPDFWYQYLVPPHGEEIDARMDLSAFLHHFNLRSRDCDAARFVIRSDASRLFVGFGLITPPKRLSGGTAAASSVVSADASHNGTPQQRADATAVTPAPGEAKSEEQRPPAFSLQTQRDMELPFIEVDPDEPEAALQVVRMKTLEGIGTESLEATNDADYQFSATIADPKRFETAIQCVSTDMVKMSLCRNGERKTQLLIHSLSTVVDRREDVLAEGIDLEDVEFPEDGDAFECFFKMLHLHKVCKMPKAHKLRIHLAEGVPLKLRWTLPRHAEFTLFLNQCGLD